jgi:AcrR family transcriptional regulator
LAGVDYSVNIVLSYVDAVNIQSEVAAEAGPRAYHHGNLRAALIDAGLQLLEAGGEAPGLREVAREVGVSAGAVYRHFDSKQVLLRALAAEGVARLAEAQGSARAAAGHGLKGFNAVGQAYVRFALANPALYRLMFATAPRIDQLGSAPAEVSLPMQQLRGNIAELFDGRMDEAQQRVFVLRAWATVHGLAMLALDRQVEPAMVEALLAQVVDARLFGNGLD